MRRYGTWNCPVPYCDVNLQLHTFVQTCKQHAYSGVCKLKVSPGLSSEVTLWRPIAGKYAQTHAHMQAPAYTYFLYLMGAAQISPFYKPCTVTALSLHRCFFLYLCPHLLHTLSQPNPFSKSLSHLLQEAFLGSSQPHQNESLDL